MDEPRQDHPSGLSRRWLLLGLGAAGLAGSYAAWAALRPARAHPSAPPEPPDDLCLVAPLQAWSPELGPKPLAARMPQAHSRCPVCGMYPARQPHWSAQLIYRDGDAHFFDTVLCLLRYVQDPARHAPGREVEAIGRIYLAAYRDRGSDDGATADVPPQWLPSENAWLLADARLQGRQAGPMRHAALPVLASAEAAQALQARWGGTVMAWTTLRQLPPQRWPRTLQGAGAGHRHGAAPG